MLREVCTVAVLLAAYVLVPALGYGPPPAKGKKHRTTTTTQLPDSSNEIQGIPNYQGPPSGPPDSPPAGGSDFWWMGPGSPFKPGQSLPQPPPGPGGCGGPAGCTQSPNSQPTDFSHNPFLQGIGKPQPSYPTPGQPNQSPGQYPTQGPNPQYPQNQGPKPGSFLPSQPSGQYPNGGPNAQYPSNQGPKPSPFPPTQPSGQYPNQGPKPQYPSNQGPKPGSFPPSQPSGQYPNEGPKPQYPSNQGPNPGSFPPSQPSGQYPNQGPNPQYPSNEGPKPGSVPPSQPSGQYPNGPNPQYPSNQGSKPSIFPPNQPSGQYPNQGPNSNPFPPSQPSGQYPNQGPNPQYPSNQGPEPGSFPSSQPSGQYPNGPNPQYPSNQGSKPSPFPPNQPSGQYPNEGPNPQYPSQEPKPGSFPPRQPSGQYPNLGPKPQFPSNQGPKPGSFPPSQPSGQYPNEGPNPQYPSNQGPKPGSFPPSKPSGQYPNQGPNPQYPSNQGPKPGFPPSQPSGQYPNQGPNPQYPSNEGPKPGSFPPSQPSGQFPNQRPEPSPFPPNQPSGQYPNQGPNPQNPSNQGPKPGPFPPSQPSGQYPNQGPKPGSFPPNQPSGQYPIPQYPSSGQNPVPFPPAQPSGQYPVPAYPNRPVSQPPSKPIDISNNPFLQSALQKPVPVACQGYSCGGPSKPATSGSSTIPCATPGYACVPKDVCSRGVVSKPQADRFAGGTQCDSRSSTCCRVVPTSPDGYPRPGTSYGQPGTNGIPIGGSIYDKNNPQTPVTAGPYTGPLNTTPHPGCAAALKCVDLTLCTWDGVMADSPQYLTREQQESRVPLSDCADEVTGVVGKCCRDPNYKDPWPAGMMMPHKGHDDGLYHPDKDEEQSSAPNSNAGLYYNTISSTTPFPSKGHTLKKPIGGFNVKPSPFPIKPGQSQTPPPGFGIPQTAPISPQPAQPKYPGVGPNNEPRQPQYPQSGPNIPVTIQPQYPLPSPIIPGPVQSRFPQDGSNIPVLIQPQYPQPGASIPGPIQSRFPQDVPGPAQPQPGTSAPQYPLPGPAKPFPPPFPGTVSSQPLTPVSFPSKPSIEVLPPQSGPSSQPQEPDSQGQVPNSQGQVPDSQGQSLDSQGQVPDSQGQSPDSQGQLPDSQGQVPDSQGQVPDIQLRVPENQVPYTPSTGCGVRGPPSNAGPDDAGFAEFPWQALIVTAGNRSAVCGAAIVSSTAVVTAAHCLENLLSGDLLVKGGEWKLNSQQHPKPVQVRPAAAIARHPGFNTRSLARDLAVVVLSLPFNLEQHVNTICLPQPGEPQQDRKCIATGWGKNALLGRVSDSVLHQVKVTFVPKDQCENSLRQTHLGRHFILNEGFSCAVPSSTSSLCKVDIGGPVGCERLDGHYELAGVNSWDVGCEADKAPAVLASSDTEWLNTVINTPPDELAKQEAQYNQLSHRGESIEGVDIDSKPGFALGYGK